MTNEKIDILNRDDFITKLVNLTQLMAQSGHGYCFGINGAWGSGKSFLLEKFEKTISQVQSEETADNFFFVFHYDCWKYDYYDEPSVAIVSAMLDAAEKELSLISVKADKVLEAAWNKAKNKLKKMAGELCQNRIGINIVEIVDDILTQSQSSDSKSFDFLYGFKRALESTRKGIAEIAQSKTIIVVVDELDRCLPAYSIKVLERLHHIFVDLDNVIVIISMDKTQLEHSIKGIYGDIDADKYLRKFISFKIDLDNGAAEGYSQKFSSYYKMFTIPEHDRTKIEEFFRKVLQGLDMRTQERIFQKAEVIHNIISNGQKLGCSIMAFEILFLTLALLTKTKQIDWFCDLYENISDLGTFAQKNAISFEYCEMLAGYAKSAISDHKGKDGLLAIKHTFEGQVFFWMANMFHAYTDADKTCQKYYYKAPVADTVSLIHRFSEYIDIIDVD